MTQSLAQNRDIFFISRHHVNGPSPEERPDIPGQEGDEPAAGLDPKGRDKILAQIKKYHDEYGKTILLVSHSMEDIVKYAGKVLVMNKSRLFCYDTVDRVFARTDELAKIGLDVPQITRMSHILKSLGTDIGNDIYTTQRAAERLLPLIR